MVFTSPPWNEHRCLFTIFPVRTAEVNKHLGPLRQTIIDINEHREHQGGYDRRPLDKHADHDKKQTGILGMPYVAIGAICYKAAFSTMDQLPTLPHNGESDEREPITDKMYDRHHGRPASEENEPQVPVCM